MWKNGMSNVVTELNTQTNSRDWMKGRKICIRKQTFYRLKIEERAIYLDGRDVRDARQ